MITKSAFHPAWWLSNPHAQTLYAARCRFPGLPTIREERIELLDGDFIDVVWADKGLSKEAPLVILLHGLGGGIDSSPYIRGQMLAYQRLGLRSVVMHFRGAGKEPNRMLRSYHMGDTADLDYFIQLLAQREPQTRKYVVGFSLGGSVLLKWLGERGEQTTITAAVAVSVPFQLNLCADRLNRGLSRLYQMHLIRQLRQHFLRKQQHHLDDEFLQKLQSSNCFWTFDNHITAPLHGFKDVHEYYRLASSRAYLSQITTPTLIIHASDDPFTTPEAIPRTEELSPAVTLELSRYGGHVGFISGSIPIRPKFWLEERIPQFLSQS
ncbi:MAG: hydrolase [Gammaproteobacteria bacterium]|nr:hydrolase [Gammaproteobacteria bacterium]